MRSSPQVTFAAAISDKLAQALRQGRSSRWCGFPPPEQLKPFPVPPNEGIGFDIPQSITPGEQLAESRHDPPRGIAGPARLSLSLLKQCQLLPEEQILRCERAPSPATDGDKPNEVEQNQYCCGEAMPESDEQTHLCGHERLSIARFKTLRGGESRREKFLRSTGGVRETQSRLLHLRGPAAPNRAPLSKGRSELHDYSRQRELRRRFGPPRRRRSNHRAKPNTRQNTRTGEAVTIASPKPRMP